jgi:hypothetical protein
MGCAHRADQRDRCGGLAHGTGSDLINISIAIAISIAGLTGIQDLAHTTYFVSRAVSQLGITALCRDHHSASQHPGQRHRLFVLLIAIAYIAGSAQHAVSSISHT